MITRDYLWVDTYFGPTERVGFYFDLPYKGVWEVVARINSYD